MAYPELVSRGVSNSRKFKWLVKVGAYKDVNPLILKNHGRGGGFRATRKPPWIRHWGGREGEREGGREGGGEREGGDEREKEIDKAREERYRKRKRARERRTEGVN